MPVDFAFESGEFAGVFEVGVAEAVVFAAVRAGEDVFFIPAPPAFDDFTGDAVED